jgi:ABC-type sugar transport system ATPase subunit
VIVVEQLSVTVGSFSLEEISFSLAAGEYGILMGRTGSGKTTLLESLCGLKSVVSGRILINGKDVTNLQPGARGIGFVPQEGALFHKMSVRDQIGFALQIRRQPASAVAARVRTLAELLGISDLLERGPEGLSGGERQRVALGRALAARPSVLCLDEPFSALDDETRGDMYNVVRSVTREAGVTTIHITHSRAEAEQLGDCILRIVDGRIEQSEPASGTEPAAGPTGEIKPADEVDRADSEAGESVTGDGPSVDVVVECDG